MENIATYISIFFISTVILTIFIFYKAANNSKTTITVIITWLILQTILGISEFYTVTNTFPPRFLLLVFPPILLIAILFISKKGRRFIDHLDIKTLTILHIIRIPVEIVLYWLFLNKAVPELMTFEGRNFDILSGLTAPLIYYFGFVKNKMNKNILLLWNLICLGLLINVVINAVLSSPFQFQQFAFDQPNIAVLYLPFNCLPSCVVPLVLFSHLATIRQLLNKS